MKKNIYAIICGSGSYNDLGLIRSCGEAGFKVIYITEDKPVYPIYKSKYLIQTIYIRFIESVFINKIIELADKYINIFIFPASDKCALLIDKNYILLKDKCKFPNAKGNLSKLMDKEYMVNLAKSCGLLVPLSQKYNLLEDNDFSNIEYPCIIKPLKSVLGEKSDITICENENELFRIVDHFKNKNQFNVLVQKFITGNKKREIAIPGVRGENGKTYIEGEVQKERIFGNGSTVYGKYNVEIKRKEYNLLEIFLEKSCFVGIFDIEFLETEDGLLYFIECNFRNGAYGYAITYSGFNMPLRWINSCVGIENEIMNLKDVTFMEERTDFLNVLDKTMTFRAWFKDFLKTDVCLFWNKKDIGPMLRIPYFIKKIFR